jgi:hypothetical protein
VKIADAKVVSPNVRDEVVATTNPSVKIVRLTLHRTTGDDYVHLNEWDLYSPVSALTSISICPGSYYLIPGYVKTYTLTGIDAYGFVQPLTSGITWTSSDNAVATVNANGLVRAVSTGTATISAAYQNLTAQSTLTVGNNYTPEEAEKKTVKVALLIEDPFIPGSSTVRWHERFGWNDPVNIANQLVTELNQASDNTVEFVIAQSTYGDINFTDFDGNPTDSSFFYHRYETPEGRDELLYWAGHLSGHRLRYDYTSMLNFYDYCALRENGTIDEVWVLTHPAAGLAESTLAGPGAFWYNSTPVAVSSCVKLLPIMGFNNDVDVDNALHSMGHRMESTMAHVYGAWNPVSEPPGTPFDLFTWIDKDHKDKSQVGNIHFTPNSLADYEYGSTASVINFAENWNQYPLIGNNSEVINCEEWGCQQLGYMRWWFSHVPKYKGINDGVLNDWWYYMVHYEDAVSAARQMDPGCGNQLPAQDPSGENIMPVVSIVEPESGSIYSAPANIEIKAVTFDDDGFVTKVEFYEGTNKIGESVFAPFTFTWSNVPAGVYSLTAKATDNNGATATSEPVTVTVQNNVYEDIYGPSCANKNQTIRYSLDTSLIANAYHYSWWYNGYTQSITPVPGQPYAVDIETGEWFGAGQVCIGVDYNAAPWYRRFCKTVVLCTTREAESEWIENTNGTVAYPNPYSDYFILNINPGVSSVTILNSVGQTAEQSTVDGNLTYLKLGEHLSSGIYSVIIKYGDGHQDLIKVCKQ